MRISDWSSDVCSSDLAAGNSHHLLLAAGQRSGELIKALFYPWEYLQHLVHFLLNNRARRAFERAHDKVIADGEVGKQLPAFRDHADAACHHVVGCAAG